MNSRGGYAVYEHSAPGYAPAYHHHHLGAPPPLGRGGSPLPDSGGPYGHGPFRNHHMPGTAQSGHGHFSNGYDVHGRSYRRSQSSMSNLPYEHKPYNADAVEPVIEKNVGMANVIAAGSFYGRRSRFVICPDSHTTFRGLPLLAYWDLLMLLLLGFVSFVTPFEVAFVDESGVAAFFAANLFIDACFGVDMILQFFLMYRDGGSGHWVSRHSQIVRHYLKGWFVIDALSIFPFVAVGRMAAESVGYGGLYVNKLRAFKFLRLLRALKLVRLLKFGRLAQRWSAEIVIPHLVVTVVQFLAILIVSSHWVACLLGIMMELQEDGTKPYTMKREIEGKHPNFEEGQQLSTYSLYVACLYW